MTQWEKDLSSGIFERLEDFKLLKESITAIDALLEWQDLSISIQRHGEVLSEYVPRQGDALHLFLKKERKQLIDEYNSKYEEVP